MLQPFTHDDLYALLQRAATGATAVQSSGAEAVVDRMRQFMTAQLAEKLPQYLVQCFALSATDSRSHYALAICRREPSQTLSPVRLQSSDDNVSGQTFVLPEQAVSQEVCSV
ncbi:hypothetical protein ABIE53_001022 [Burkholderia sp. OAS925]